MEFTEEQERYINTYCEYSKRWHNATIMLGGLLASKKECEFKMDLMEKSFLKIEGINIANLLLDRQKEIQDLEYLKFKKLK
jgi:hypothetical protein